MATRMARKVVPQIRQIAATEAVASARSCRGRGAAAASETFGASVVLMRDPPRPDCRDCAAARYDRSSGAVDSITCQVIDRLRSLPQAVEQEARVEKANRHPDLRRC